MSSKNSQSRPSLQSILRPPSNNCSSASCRTTTTTKRVTFATDISIVNSPIRPLPPSTLPPRLTQVNLPAPPVKHRRHHHHRHHHHRCKKHANPHSDQLHQQDQLLDRREKDQIVHDSVAISDAVAKRQRRLDAGVSKRRTPVAQRRGESTVKQKKKQKKTRTTSQKDHKRSRTTANPSPTNGNANTSRATESSSRRDRERVRANLHRADRKPFRDTTASRTTQVLTATADAGNSNRKPRREGKDDDKEDKLVRRDSRDNRENENDDRRRSRRVSSSTDDLRKVQRSLARRLQLGRDDMTYAALQPVHASVLYEAYVRTKGDGERDDKLRRRLEDQERREGRNKGSRRMLAKLVGLELGRDVDMLKQLPRRVLVERFVVDACLARMERLKNRRRVAAAR